VRELTISQEEALEKQYQNQPDVLRQKIYELRGEAVKELIDKQLILQEFKKMEEKGASIPDYIVEDHIQTIIRGQFNGDRAAFIRTLDAQGMTLARYRQEEKEKIIVSAMREREIQKDAFIPPRDVQEYYAKHPEEFNVPTTIHLRMISLAKGGATDATQKKLADEIRQKVAVGADFGKMAQFYSDTHAQDGGDYGWVTSNDINEQLGKVAFSLKPGQVSNTVDSSGSYWLLYVEARKPGGSKAFKDVRDDIQKKLLQVQQQETQEKWLAGLRQKAYINKNF
jgi:peptidyl-prolyl cis-trans isomerase SurA